MERNNADKSRVIPYGEHSPHYSDGRFRDSEMTIFMADGVKTVRQFNQVFVEGAQYEYSDRLQEWYGHEKIKAAFEKARSVVGGDDREITAAYFEEYLKALYDNDKLELVHVISGVNRGNGYPYRVYGFIPHKD